MTSPQKNVTYLFSYTINNHSYTGLQGQPVIVNLGFYEGCVSEQFGLTLRVNTQNRLPNSFNLTVYADICPVATNT